MNNKDCIILLKGNHDVYFVELIKVYKEVLKFSDVFNWLKIYVKNYVSGFEKIRDSLTNKKFVKWATTERRNITMSSYKAYTKLCKQYCIQDYWKLVNFYERCFNIRKLMTELVDNPEFDYDSIVEYINSCKLIEMLTVDNNKWVLYHNQYSDLNLNEPTKNNQLVSRLGMSYVSKNVNYVYGHTPIPKMLSKFTSRRLNYNEIFKSEDYSNNKYYDIDVSHYGLCFFNLETLEETYVGRNTNIMDSCKSYNFEKYEIKDITPAYSREKFYIIRKNGYYFSIAHYNPKEKLLSFYEICNLFNENDNDKKINKEKLPSMEDILKIFIDTLDP